MFLDLSTFFFNDRLKQCTDKATAKGVSFSRESRGMLPKKFFENPLQTEPLYFPCSNLTSI